MPCAAGMTSGAVLQQRRSPGSGTVSVISFMPELCSGGKSHLFTSDVPQVAWYYYMSGIGPSSLHALSRHQVFTIKASFSYIDQGRANQSGIVT